MKRSNGAKRSKSPSGAVRTEVWRNYGSIGGLGAKFSFADLRYRPVRDSWIAEGHIILLPQRIWRTTLSDSLDDIKANRRQRKSRSSYF